MIGFNDRRKNYSNKTPSEQFSGTFIKIKYMLRKL